MASAELLTLIRTGNRHKCLPDSAYETNIKPIYEAGNADITVEFDPKKHLSFDPVKAAKVRRMTMEELGLSSPDQISDIGVSDPFDLFTDEAIEIMRSEILRKEVFDKFARVSHSSTSGMDCTLRGYAQSTSPFTYAAWKHPATVAAVSAMAGIELEVIMDYEIAHCNIAMKPEDEAISQRMESKRKTALNEDTNADIPAVIGWHNDSYPFVCVLMLSDTTEMIGGETLLKTGYGKIVPTPGPSKGKACILQGRQILHLAPIPVGFTERITTVTSYRAKSPHKPETSVLSTVKPEVNFGSQFNIFYPEWIDYRMNIISARCDALKEKSLKDREEGKEFSKEAAMEELKSIEAYIAKTWKEMEVTDEEYVKHMKKAEMI